MVGGSGEGLKNQNFHKNFEGINKPRKSMAEKALRIKITFYMIGQRKMYEKVCQGYEQVDRYKKQEEEEDISFKKMTRKNMF